MKRLGLISMVLWMVAGCPAAARAGWQTFDTGDGLPGMQIQSIAEDRQGNLWFASQMGGIARYDGARWMTFAQSDGLAYDLTTVVHVDRAGDVWVGTQAGLSRFDGTTWTTYTRQDGLASDDCRAIAEDRAGNLWVGHWGGVSRFDGSLWRSFTTADGIAGEIVLAIVEDRDGSIWVGTNNGVSRFDGTLWTTPAAATGAPVAQVGDVARDSNDHLWFATSVGLFRYDGERWSQELASWCYAVATTRAGTVWAATSRGGIERYAAAGWRHFDEADGVPYPEVLDIHEDRSGNLWFSSWSSGVCRYDGEGWRVLDLPVPSTIGCRTMAEDRDGRLWFGSSEGANVLSYDGTQWRAFSIADGLANGGVHDIAVDASGNLWFATNDGVSRFDGTQWRTFSTADGLSSNQVRAILEDRAGNLWFGTYSGVTRFDGVNWTVFTTEDGLGANLVSAIAEDRSGNIWVADPDYTVSRFDGSTWQVLPEVCNGAGTDIVTDQAGSVWISCNGGGIARFDGHGWQTFDTARGLPSNIVFSITEDRDGVLWFGALEGIARYDGARWRTFTVADGLASNIAYDGLEDRAGSLWFLNGRYVTLHDRDRTPPRTVVMSQPVALSTARAQATTFVAAFGEVASVEFSTRLDGGPWSAWTATGLWQGDDLADGSHVLEVRSRDYADNVESTPALVAFEVDATPPAPVLAEPAFGHPVRGVVALRGTADDARFERYRIEVRPGGVSSWEQATVLVDATSPVMSGILVNWDTSALPDGGYDLRLSVTDTLGLTGTALSTVIVDNHAPYFDETSPARISATLGGDAFTTAAESHLYFAPHAFAEDAVVTIEPNAPEAVPATLPSGATRALNGYALGWTATLAKPARFELSLAGVSPGAGALALHHSSDGTNWERLGGTVEADRSHITLTVTRPGRYALFSETAAPEGTGVLGGLSFTPRVFSPRGGFADREVGISFTLGRSGPVSVRVYSTSGRLIREVASGQWLGAGANLLRWDGRDRAGGTVTDGMYLVTVEALGEVQRRPLAVVK